jgi:hypothetical protein
MLRWFMGMTPMGYALFAVVAALLLSWSAMFFMGKNIQKLNRDIGAQATTIRQQAAANLDMLQSLDQVEALLQECVKARDDAKLAADKAVQGLNKKAEVSYKEMDTRRDLIEDAIQEQAPVCIPSTIPSRTAELLIEATRSANRGTDGP